MIAHSRLLLLCGLFACEHTAETDTRNTQTSRSGPNGPPSPDRGRTPSVVGDADDDGVADSADECPDEGVWDDFDGDGCADDNRQMACDGDWLQGHPAGGRF